uniref:Chromatin-remodeling complex ATPase chain n=1 Tax=Grammatophora oceanica TaxID=210454 RepID=A0A7S1V1Z3_9STRA|mmetsp:Transcript_31557/g.46816  ORF Transcript_31557/g.46816 Transcript_31557/m.46816 type:complete len:1493 (+) Transcript_31557:214-4692(+)|eukprot:CAMPEP_0194053274 /NCGR_PEP_ID=MMETSP0009_2-20130614/49092_1 /TAXON_ID=210454 /ORGANISM="Grammatophora oceanica, Strain CCMP 410" /LENGTH=1492 /DNA_ID=CAMNT_0038701279 /DNA_START=160 /DNA_END=4638 /DNA_ORIENTATION=-
MPRQVKTARTAFQFYQAATLKPLRAELGAGRSMGECMTELAARWKALDEDGRATFLAQEAEDRQRFAEESAEADALRLAESEARRANLTVQEGESHSSRGARASVDKARREKEERRAALKAAREAEMDPEELAERERIRAEKKAEVDERKRKRAAQEKAVTDRHKKMTKQESQRAQQRLEYLLKQSSIFGKLKMGSGKPGGEAAAAAPEKKPHNHREHEKEVPEGENEEDIEEEEEKHVFLTKQPNCIKFGTLKGYQLEGLNWMIHLAEKGLNGILADEMGLGKTLQSISILAYQYEFMKVQGPHLVCVPKSTLSNWMNELNRWCPSLRAIKFHGVKEEREMLKEEYFSNEAASHDGRRPERRYKDHGEWVDDNSDNPRAWDVCVTTYEVCNTERKTLQKFAWKYLVIDEAHRLKNEASMFSKTVRSFHTQYRLLLTGTPLQNNLHELWALLNFLLPDIFTSSEQFDEWFNLEIDDEDAKTQMISQLHKILRPFMIRRLKADVAKGLPPKTETLVMVGMSKMQKQLYKKLLLRDLDSIVGTGSNRTAVLNIVMQLRKCCGHPYLFEGVEDRTLDPLGEHLVDNCGKLVMVDKLLKRLKERESRVLIFTQMTRVLDILEDFLVMRKYNYCRIDGNTIHEDREASIEDFNREGSEKFVFILSTRAGGLGINLQTADVCILYDSDWNPQADLQAQDRCHRLGQKKPVSVYRLVSENTIEEKIVERAKQKLKLDAMVVQQGRLKESNTKVSKEEIMAAIRFGADKVFRSEDSTISDEDIDAILARGAERTKELEAKLQNAEKGDLLDFRMDAGLSAQTFEGVDYSDRELRDQLRLMAADNMGKRERRPPPQSYAPVVETNKSMVVGTERVKLPSVLRLPRMEDHQFYNRERLVELDKLEFETYATLREIGQLPPRDEIEKKRSLLPEELAEEKIGLLDEGFGDWTKTQFFNFVKASAKFGRDDVASISAELDMPEEKVSAYSTAFWKYAATELKKEEWDRISATIDRGEKKIAKQKKLTSLLKKFVSTFENPRTEMVFANKGTTHYALEQDRALICAVDKHGYGNWERIREEIRHDTNLKFQHSVQGMNTDMIAKRVDYRMRQMEKECEAREKVLKAKKPANVLAAEKAIAAIKEVDKWEHQSTSLQLRGDDAPGVDGLTLDARQLISERLRERLQHIDRLREIEIQVHNCLNMAEDVKKSIQRGDQYVNYSHITLKSSGTKEGREALNVLRDTNGETVEARINKGVLKVPQCGQCESCTDKNNRQLCTARLAARKRLVEAETKKMEADVRKNGGPPVKNAGQKRKLDEVAPKSSKSKSDSNGGLNGCSPAQKNLMKKKPRITSQGNKRMAIPQELIPEFCRRIGAHGTAERMKLINKFVEDYPDISVRQVTIRFSELTTKNCPPGIAPPEKKSGRSFQFYLRPRHYDLLKPEQRPPDWERLKAEDEVLWQKEKEEERVKKAMKKSPGQSAASSLASSPVPTEADMESVSAAGSDN